MSNSKIIRIFKEQVAQMKELPALICKDRTISYEELDLLSEKCASFIDKNYKNIDTTIPFIASNSIESIVFILGILKSGRGFLPVDKEFPLGRIELICSNCNVYNVLCDMDGQNFYSEDAYNDVKFIHCDISKVCYDDVDNLKENKMGIAYVLYTSGSTGQPKGVLIEETSLLSFKDAISTLIDFSKGKRILSSTAFSFDISILETLIPLLYGMTVVIANDNERKNPKLLRQIIVSNNIQIVQMTPSMLSLLIDDETELPFFDSVTELLIGGEPFPNKLYEKLKGKVKSRIFNLYGPTEATIWCTAKELGHDNKITIGKALPGNEIYITDGGKLIQNDEIGEICISGSQLSLGYLNDHNLSKERFTYNPFNKDTKIYRTGDLGRWTQNGEIDFIGRKDTQVKINGHRIELEEIENALQKCSEIKEVITLLIEKSESEKFLCAFYTGNYAIENTKLNTFLIPYLPEYMIPSDFMWLEKMPLTTSGKIDRKNLFQHYNLLSDDRKGAEVSSNDCVITTEVKKIIRLNTKVNIEESVFKNNESLKQIGVDSLSLIKILIGIEEVFDFDFSDGDLYSGKFNKVSDLVNYIKEKIQVA